MTRSLTGKTRCSFVVMMKIDDLMTFVVVSVVVVNYDSDDED